MRSWNLRSFVLYEAMSQLSAKTTGCGQLLGLANGYLRLTQITSRTEATCPFWLDLSPVPGPRGFDAIFRSLLIAFRDLTPIQVLRRRREKGPRTPGRSETKRTHFSDTSWWVFCQFLRINCEIVALYILHVSTNQALGHTACLGVHWLVGSQSSGM